MKKCPRCEFIYEDDQNHCDMDGALLIPDSRTLPNLRALATVPGDLKAAQRRNRAVPTFATLVLALVLGMVYYVSTRPPSAAPATPPSTLNVAPVTIPIPEPQPAAEPAPAIEESKPAPAKEIAAPTKKPATKTTSAASKTKRNSVNKKEDSKVNSIIKKTGRMLKKPFKKL